MLRTLLALAALQALAEARKRRRVRSGSGGLDCYYYDYYAYEWVYYECEPAGDPGPEPGKDDCAARSQAFADAMWLKVAIEADIDGACPDGRITEITAGPPTLVKPGPVTTLQLGREPVTPLPRMPGANAKSGAQPGVRPGARPKPGQGPGGKHKPGPGAGKRGPHREPGQVIDVAAQTMVRARESDECGTDLPGGEKLACFKCAHDRAHAAGVSQCDYRRASHIRRLESLHRRWERLVALEVSQYWYCDGLHNNLDAANAELAEDPTFCAECQQSDINGFCSGV